MKYLGHNFPISYFSGVYRKKLSFLSGVLKRKSIIWLEITNTPVSFDKTKSSVSALYIKLKMTKSDKTLKGKHLCSKLLSANEKSVKTPI